MPDQDVDGGNLDPNREEPSSLVGTKSDPLVTKLDVCDASNSSADKPESSRTDESARREKGALQRLEVARNLSISANRVFIIFVVSLLLIWVQRVLPDFQRVQQVRRAKEQFLTVRGTIRSLPREDLAPHPMNTLELEHDWQAKLNEARKESLKLPGGFDLEVPAYYSPLVWTVICLTLFWYLDFNRRRHFSLMGRALRILREHAGYSDEDLTDIVPVLPWWLVPLPPRDGTVITATQFRNAAGWIATRRRLEMAALVFFVALLGVQLFTLWICWETFSVLELQDKLGQFFFHQLTAALVFVTFICTTDWLRRARVPDNLAQENNPNQWGRREVLLSFGSGLLTLLWYPSWNVFSSYRKTKPVTLGTEHANPRFKRKRRRLVTLPDPVGNTAEKKLARTQLNGRLNERTGVVHYVARNRPQACFYGVSGPRIEVMKSVDFSEAVLKPGMSSYALREEGAVSNPLLSALPSTRPLSSRSKKSSLHDRRDGKTAVFTGYRMHADHASWSVEQEVEILLGQGNKGLTDACALLRKAINAAPRSLRLYDRLAVISVKYKLGDQLTDLIGLVQQRLALENALRSRCTDSGQPESEAQTNLVRHPGLQFWSEFLDRAIGRTLVKTSKLRHSKHKGRSRCKEGNQARRNAPVPQIRPPEKFAKALRARVAAWKNPGSPWYQKWAKGKVWVLPEPAKKGKPICHA